MTIINGESFGKYRILSEIGKGGMGEVYLAQDTKLDRQVAIKFLSDEFSKDVDKLNRFVQEAKATSALNHPNILTVHEIDQFEDTHYIVTEYIEGQTLRERLSEKDSVPLNNILKIGIQVAEALSAAHGAGIAHRDIKPENIMIREDGYVKVLDFGLAKLTEKNKPENDISLEGETKVLVKTNPGVGMGTVSYMSPEQARGKETDERTDIWSLGVVLYEMLSGKVPFAGETLNHTIVAILETEPKFLENVPDELQRIVRKTLTKEKENRYQTARDLLIDLKNLRHELKVQGEIERSIIPNKDLETTAENETAVYTNKSIEGTGASGQGPVTQNVTTASSLEYAVGRAKSNKLLSAILGVILVGLITAGGYFAFFAGSDSKAIRSIAVMPFVNESGNKDIEYLADGMTETLINSLSQLSNLNVKAKSSVFRYKGKETDPQTIGKELNVEAILNGRITQRGDQLTLSLELINAQTENVLWGNKYERKFSELVSLMTEIARDVSGKLKTKLSGEDEQKLTKKYTENPKAFEAYLKGRFYWGNRTGDNLKKGITFFNQAIELDPNYALAWSGLADSYSVLPWYTSTSIKEAHPKARAAAEKAVALDPELAEARTSLAETMLDRFDITGAEKEFKAAIKLNPKYATAHQWYGEVLMIKGDLRESRKASELEPFSAVMSEQVGELLYFLNSGSIPFRDTNRMLFTISSRHRLKIRSVHFEKR